MAKIIKDIKIFRYLEIRDKINPWLGNKIQRIRSQGKRQAYRAAKRWGAPAGVSLLLLITLYSLLLPKDRFQAAKEQLLKNPKNFEAHLILAEEFLKNNQVGEAEKELMTASSIQQTTPKDSRVLGTMSKFQEIISLYQEKNPKEIENLISKWENIISETPNYRDGYLYLALYYFKLGNKEAAQENLAVALTLDPNYEPARKLEKIIK